MFNLLKRVGISVIVFALMATTFIVCAEEITMPAKVTQSAPMELLTNIIYIFGGAIGLLATGLVNIILTALARKYNIQVNSAIKQEIGMAIQTGIASAEAWASKMKDTPSGNEKLDHAVGVVRALAGSEIGKRFTDVDLKNFIEAHLLVGAVNPDTAMPIHDITASVHDEDVPVLPTVPILGVKK